jgi:hypothetical protein
MTSEKAEMTNEDPELAVTAIVTIGAATVIVGGVVCCVW